MVSLLARLSEGSLEQDPVTAYHLDAEIPGYATILTLTATEHMIVTGCSTLVRATNAQLAEMMVKAYQEACLAAIPEFTTPEFVPKLLVLTDELLNMPRWERTVLQTVGLFPGNLFLPRRIVLAANTEDGVVLLHGNMKPTFVREPRTTQLPGWMQGFWPMWELTTEWVAKIQRHPWTFDLGMSNVQVLNGTLVMVIGPVMSSGADRHNDFFFPGPPPGFLKIPILAFSSRFTTQEIAEKVRPAIRTVMTRKARFNGRTVLRIAFKSLRLTEPAHHLLVVSESEFTVFVSELRTYLMRSWFPVSAEAHFDGTATPEVHHVLTLLPTVHSV